ncbi:unnamed protein product [Boreogadus saida]
MPLNVVTDDFRSDAHYGAVQARAIIVRVFLSFKERVKALGPKDKGRPTVRKNNIYDFSKWDVLPQDQRFLLGILDEAIGGETENQDFQIMKTLSRFGQKSEAPCCTLTALTGSFQGPGCIATCGHMHWTTGAKMLKRARDYLAHMGDLEEKLVGQMSMRLEMVCKYMAGVEGVPAFLEPQSLFGMEELRCLLKTRPLVVPFKDTADGSGVVTTLRAVTRPYVVELTGLLRNSIGLSTWSAYQAELALEEGPQPPGKVAKAVEVGKLTEDLATRDSFRDPSAFGWAREIAKAKGHDIKDLLTQGLDQLDLKFLPHYTLRDIRKRKVLSWEDGRFVEVLRPGQKPCDESWAAGLTEALLQRLSPRMADKPRIIVLTFLSCVGMLMRGEYAVYEHLKSLLAELPIPQSKMVQMKIQVAFQVSQIKNATIFRLDADISTKHQGLVHRPQIGPKRKREEGDEEEKEEEVLEDVQEVDQEEEQPVQPHTLSMAIPATSRRVWSKEELRMADWN